MKAVLEYITFYLKLVFFVSCLTFVITFAIYTFGKLTNSYDMTILELFLYSGLSAITNGIILGLIAVIILTGLYYYHLGNEKLRQRNDSRSKARNNDP